MSYFQQLGANLEDASLFIALELVQAEIIGQITREGFVKGWSSQPYVTLSTLVYILFCISIHLILDSDIKCSERKRT